MLICGKSGVGKELIARGLHQEIDRARGPLMPVNCAGLPAERLTSEWSGHACRALTGAQRARRGLFNAAHGANLERTADVRMVAATQRDLEREMARKEFRKDLFDRAYRSRCRCRRRVSAAAI